MTSDVVATVTNVFMATALCIGSSACTSVPTGASTASSAAAATATVEEVVDGDTIIVKSGGDSERVRLIGIDTPETVHPTKPVECFGPEASARTKGLLPRGTQVVLLRDIEGRDRYERVLAYVYRVSDGLFVNLDLVLGGFATAYPFPPNDTLSTQFSRAEHLARSAGSGMWSACPKDKSN